MFRRTSGQKKDRFGEFFFKIFGPATVEGAIQGWQPEAREQYKRLRARQKEQAAAARRDEGRGW
jgi:hypothetical protein